MPRSLINLSDAGRLGALCDDSRLNFGDEPFNVLCCCAPAPTLSTPNRERIAEGRRRLRLWGAGEASASRQQPHAQPRGDWRGGLAVHKANVLRR